MPLAQSHLWPAFEIFLRMAFARILSEVLVLKKGWERVLLPSMKARFVAFLIHLDGCEDAAP